MSLHHRLRAGTSEIHRRTENLPFQEAIRYRAFPGVAYREYLRSLLPLREALEEALPAALAPVSSLWDSTMERASLVHQDLMALEGIVSSKPGGAAGSPSLALVRGLMAGHAIRVAARGRPASLVGFAYVLEGATQGGAVLARQLQDSGLLTGPEGLSFLKGGGTGTLRRSWKNFLKRLDTLTLTAEEEQAAEEGALRLFRQVHDLLASLHPLRWATPGEVARELNPEAGAHSVPSDPRVLEAGIHAGERSWADFPYYEARYGDRGRGYTRSDSAWLTSLPSGGLPHTLAQVTWLGRLLSTRGMPQWLMEEHLKLLHEELQERGVPGEWGLLREVAAVMASQRSVHLPLEDILQAGEEFRRAVPQALAARLPETGSLLAAAVADEAQGIDGAVGALTHWLADPDRFPPEWVAAVHRTVEGLRQQVSSPKPPA